MNINDIKELVDVVSKSDLTAFDYEEGNIRISLRKGEAPTLENDVKNVDKETGAVEVRTVDETVPQQEAESEAGGFVVRSPLVGTVYLAPEEGAEPFVKVGDRVKKGQTLAIVEAMKLMNEIESEVDGVVTKILVENGTTVEYKGDMFVIC